MAPAWVLARQDALACAHDGLRLFRSLHLSLPGDPGCLRSSLHGEFSCHVLAGDLTDVGTFVQKCTLVMAKQLLGEKGADLAQ